MTKYRCRIIRPHESNWRVVEQRDALRAAHEFFFVFDNLPCIKFNNESYALVEVQGHGTFIVNGCRSGLEGPRKYSMDDILLVLTDV